MLKLPVWKKEDSIVFYSSKEPYFILSNMYPGTPIELNGVVWNSSEALYQACKYPKDLEVLPKNSKTTIANVRERILKAKTPMQAKMTQKCAKHKVRPDWEDIKQDVMFACLVLKVAQHKDFKLALRSTKGKNIVEKSKKDIYWGAIDKGDYLEGYNYLGQLLMKLRDNLSEYIKNKQRYEQYLMNILNT